MSFRSIEGRIDTKISLDRVLGRGYPANQACLMLLGLREDITREGGARVEVGA